MERLSRCGYCALPSPQKVDSFVEIKSSLRGSIAPIFVLLPARIKANLRKGFIFCLDCAGAPLVWGRAEFRCAIRAYGTVSARPRIGMAPLVLSGSASGTPRAAAAFGADICICADKALRNILTSFRASEEYSYRI